MEDGGEENLEDGVQHLKDTHGNMSAASEMFKKTFNLEDVVHDLKDRHGDMSATSDLLKESFNVDQKDENKKCSTADTLDNAEADKGRSGLGGFATGDNGEGDVDPNPSPDTKKNEDQKKNGTGDDVN